MNIREFLKERRNWILDQDHVEPEVQVHEGPSGGYGIYLLINGYLADEEDAQVSAAQFKERLTEIFREEGLIE